MHIARRYHAPGRSNADLDLLEVVTRETDRMQHGPARRALIPSTTSEDHLRCRLAPLDFPAFFCWERAGVVLIESAQPNRFLTELTREAPILRQECRGFCAERRYQAE